MYNLIFLVVIATTTMILATIGAFIDGWSGFTAAVVMGLVYTILSIKVVDGSRYRGGVIFFGNLLPNVVDSGPTIVPFLIGRLELLPRGIIQMELPDEPEKVWSGTDRDGHELPIPAQLPEGMKLPIRVTFEDDDPENDPLGPNRIIAPGSRDNDPLRKRVVVKVVVIVRFIITDPLRFLQTFGSLSEAKKQLEDMTIAETLAALQVGTYARALANMDGISRLITEAIRARITDSNGSEEQWGFALRPVQIKNFSSGKELNVALQNISTGRADGVAEKVKAEGQAEATRIKARAEREKLEQEGAGRAKAEQLLLTAKAKGAKAMAKELGVKEGEVVLALQMLETGLKSGNQLIISGNNGLGDLVSMAKAVIAAKETT